MFQVIQSNDTTVLLDELIKLYQQDSIEADGGRGFAAVFTPFTVIVPSMALGDWLQKSVASKLGISTLFTAQFWGQYQWQLIQAVLKIDAQFYPNDALKVPEVAMLSGSVMRWRLFGWLSQIDKNNLKVILDDEANPLNFLLKSLYDDATEAIPEARLWQACGELSSVFVRYLTQRPEWLHAWTQDEPLPVSVEAMIAQKDKIGKAFGESDDTPDWLADQYQQLEKLLRFLWQNLFAAVYAYRERLEARFWQVLDGQRGEALAQAAIAAMPKRLILFTVQQIPSIELQFLKHLSVHIDVVLLHFNQSQMFWADIVDHRWLASQRIINPQAVYYKDSGHALLSRLAKESRETLAMLADMSGGEFYYEKHDKNIAGTDALAAILPKDWAVQWEDKFVDNFGEMGGKSSGKLNDDLAENLSKDDEYLQEKSSHHRASISLLNQLKKDILMLQNPTAQSAWLGGEIGQILQQKNKPNSEFYLPKMQPLPSLSIHACHSLKRQLEIARVMIARYLNEPNADGSARHPADVVVYLPDVEVAKDLIALVFGDGVGADGLYLPAKITGTTNRRIDELMAAITGFYSLLGAKSTRFEYTQVSEWLLTPMLYEAFGLSFDEMKRGCDLLEAAGFRRGFDAEHLSQTLDSGDYDYRYSFSDALDRIVAGFLMPNDEPSALFYPFQWANTLGEASVPLAGVMLADEPIVSALCAIFEGLRSVRDDYSRVDLASVWLEKIETQIIDKYFSKFKESTEMRAIFEAKNAIAASIRANRYYAKNHYNNHQSHLPTVTPELRLSLQFVLESITAQLSSQTVSAESSQMITFARFGALRSIPFGLTLMLGMDLAAFPRRERQARMDLMKAGLKRRGDRAMEDDDNGAFLDALLCSRDACMIFYTAVAADGVTPLLPASPVSELLEFLKTGVNWQADFHELQQSASQTLDDDTATFTELIARFMPSLIERLVVTHHASSGFDESLFYDSQAVQSEAQSDTPTMVKNWLIARIDAQKRAEQQSLPPAPLWQQVRQILDDEGKYMPASVIELPPKSAFDDIAAAFDWHLNSSDGQDNSLENLRNQYQIELPDSISLSQVFSSLKDPAGSFLRTRLQVVSDEQQVQMNEPRLLQGLDRYELNFSILAALGDGALDGVSPSAFEGDKLLASSAAPLHLARVYHGSVLPAGVSRLDYFNENLQQIGAQLTDFYEVLQNLNLVHSPLEDYSNWLSATAEKPILLTIGGQKLLLSAYLPTAGDVWLSVVASKPHSHHLLRFWLQHLAWQVHRETSEADVLAGCGVSIASFAPSAPNAEMKKLNLTGSVLRLAPIAHDTARRLLENFTLCAWIMQQIPVPMTAQNGLLLGIVDLKDEKPNSLFANWLSSFGEVRTNQSRHPQWQLILQDNDPLEMLLNTEQLAQALYRYFKQSIKNIDTV